MSPFEVAGRSQTGKDSKDLLNSSYQLYFPYTVSLPHKENRTATAAIMRMLMAEADN